MYYLWINDAQTGPYSAEQVQGMLAANQITPATLIWTEGQEQWQSTETYFSHQQRITPVPVKRGWTGFFGGVGATLAVIGAVVLFALVLLGGLIGYVAYSGSHLDVSSKTYVDEAIPAIATTWSQDELSKRESQDFKKATSDEQLSKLFSLFRRLGALKEYRGSQGQSSMNYVYPKGKLITATYVGDATFEKGEASIKINLIQEEGSWKILGFRIDSPIFLKSDG